MGVKCRVSAPCPCPGVFAPQLGWRQRVVVLKLGGGDDCPMTE